MRSLVWAWCRAWLSFGLLALLPWLAAQAAVDVREFDSEADRQRYQSFIDEMRCPKCQNQNLAGSDSPIAKDLRDQVYRMIEEGRSDKEIVDFMVDRYGEYILYRPPLSASTLVLWLGPVVLLLLGIVVLIWIVLKRRTNLSNNAADTKTLTEAEREHLDRILKSSDDETSER